MGAAVYEYEVAGVKLYADPLALARRLNRLLDGDPDGNAEAARSPEDGIAEAALAKLARAVCTAFELGEPFDRMTGRGVLAGQWEPVLAAFVGWQEKNAPPAAT